MQPLEDLKSWGKNTDSEVAKGPDRDDQPSYGSASTHRMPATCNPEKIFSVIKYL